MLHQSFEEPYLLSKSFDSRFLCLADYLTSTNLTIDTCNCSASTGSLSTPPYRSAFSQPFCQSTLQRAQVTPTSQVSNLSQFFVRKYAGGKAEGKAEGSVDANLPLLYWSASWMHLGLES